MRSPRRNRKKSTDGNPGFTLFEIILAIVILVLAIIPIMQAFGPAIFATGTEEAVSVFTNQARHTMSRILTVDYRTLNDLVLNSQANPVNLDALFGTGQEAFSFRGIAYAPTVVITDAGGGAGGLLEISVRAEQITIKTLKANY
jgi:competence protein ComGC